LGKLHLWRLSEGSARGSRRKQLVSERPSGSFTSGGFPKEANVLREASPLALPSESFTYGGVAAFRKKLHLWRLSERSFTYGDFLKEARLPWASFG